MGATAFAKLSYINLELSKLQLFSSFLEPELPRLRVGLGNRKGKIPLRLFDMIVERCKRLRIEKTTQPSYTEMKKGVVNNQEKRERSKGRSDCNQSCRADPSLASYLVRDHGQKKEDQKLY